MLNVRRGYPDGAGHGAGMRGLQVPGTNQDALNPLTIEVDVIGSLPLLLILTAFITWLACLTASALDERVKRRSGTGTVVSYVGGESGGGSADGRGGGSCDGGFLRLIRLPFSASHAPQKAAGHSLSSTGAPSPDAAPAWQTVRGWRRSAAVPRVSSGRRGTTPSDVPEAISERINRLRSAVVGCHADSHSRGGNYSWVWPTIWLVG
jgi:hypothetical protein